MVRQRACAFRRVAEIERHNDLFVRRQTERLRKFIRIEEVQPAAVDAFRRRAERKVRRNDRRVLDPRIILTAGVRKDVRLIVRDHEHGRGAVPARALGVELCERVRRLQDVHALLLKILRRRRDPTRF